MAKGSGGTRNTKSSALYKQGLEAYSDFVEGNSNYYNGFLYWKKPTEEELKAMDTVFTPLDHDMVLYKGIASDFVDYVNEMTGGGSHNGSLVGKSFIDKFYSSTSRRYITAKDYAEKVFDEDEVTMYPVIMTMKVKKGTPVADAIGLLGTDGMKLYESEITLRRNVRWKIVKDRTTYYNDEKYRLLEVEVTKK